MPKCVVSTRSDGVPLVTVPAPSVMACMTGRGARWDPPPGKMWLRHGDASYLVDVPHGFRHLTFPVPAWFLNAQIRAQAQDGVGDDAARRFVCAMQFGGLTEPQAWDVVVARFCAPFGSACEVWDDADLPDWRYRDAWRRSTNGGPIWIDEAKALAIDEARAWSAHQAAGG